MTDLHLILIAVGVWASVPLVVAVLGGAGKLNVYYLPVTIMWPVAIPGVLILAILSAPFLAAYWLGQKLLGDRHD